MHLEFTIPLLCPKYIRFWHSTARVYIIKLSSVNLRSCSREGGRGAKLKLDLSTKSGDISPAKLPSPPLACTLRFIQLSWGFQGFWSSSLWNIWYCDVGVNGFWWNAGLQKIVDAVPWDLQISRSLLQFPLIGRPRIVSSSASVLNYLPFWTNKYSPVSLVSFLRSHLIVPVD